MATSTILGPDGAPIRTADLEREIATVALMGVRRPWRDTIAPGLTPTRLAALLQSANEGDNQDYLTLAEEMEERELHYASVLGTRKLAVSGLPFTVESASDEPHDVELADAVRTHLRNGSAFQFLIDDLLDAIGKGVSVIEIGWDTSTTPWAPRQRAVEGKPRPAYLWRDPRYFQWDLETGQELRLRDEQDLVNGLPLPPWKFIIHLSRLKTGLPARAGLARLVAVSYMLKTFSLEDWAAFAEVFGRPWVIGRHSPAAKKDDIDILRTALQCLGSDTRAILPDSLRLEFQQAVQGAGGDNLFKGLVEWLDKQISKAVLGQTTSADETAGRLGAAQEKEEIRQDRILADYKQLVATLNDQLVIPFVALNWGPQAAYPRFLDTLPRQEDKAVLITALEKLVPLGLRVEASVVRDKFGLPDPAPGAEVLGAPVVAATPTPPALNRRRRLALNRDLTPDLADAELDDLTAEALADWEPQLAPVVNPVLDLANRSQTYDEFLAGLSGLLEQMSADDLVNRLAEATFKARGLGMATGG